MIIRVTARHMDLEPSLKAYVEDKLNHLSRFFDRVDEAHVVLTLEGHRTTADVTVHASKAIISSEQEADDVRGAFDRALERVERQLRRHKDRVRNQKHGPDTSEAAELLDGAVTASVGIVPEASAATPMTPEEALARARRGERGVPRVPELRDREDQRHVPPGRRAVRTGRAHEAERPRAAGRRASGAPCGWRTRRGAPEHRGAHAEAGLGRRAQARDRGDRFGRGHHPGRDLPSGPSPGRVRARIRVGQDPDPGRARARVPRLARARASGRRRSAVSVRRAFPASSSPAASRRRPR